MGDDKPRPAIPAWQRARPGADKSEDIKVEESHAAREGEDVAPTEVETVDSTNTSRNEGDQTNASSASSTTAIQPSDFQNYRQQLQPQQQQEAHSTPSTYTPQSSGPPIITYPEYLVEAHKPPPLITLSRIWNTAKIASGAAAIIYGASKYLVTPMSDSLSVARHDFALHSQSKIDEFNERLSKLVTKTPEEKRHKLDSERDETESESSDPTELYHRDMGTQTSPRSSRLNSMSETDVGAEKKKSPTEYQTGGLNIIKEHLTEMLDRSTSLEAPYADRQAKLNELRNYLDAIMYASAGISAWNMAEELGRGGDDTGGKEDAIDELKKEIRGVKGVMLSAKRFPGVAGRAS